MSRPIVCVLCGRGGALDDGGKGVAILPEGWSVHSSMLTGGRRLIFMTCGCEGARVEPKVEGLCGLGLKCSRCGSYKCPSVRTSQTCRAEECFFCGRWICKENEGQECPRRVGLPCSAVPRSA